MVTLATPLANTIAGDLTAFFVCPLLLALVFGVVKWIREHNRRVTVLEQAVAIALGELTPKDKPSIRDMVADNRHKLSEMAADDKATRRALNDHIKASGAHRPVAGTGRAPRHA